MRSFYRLLSSGVDALFFAVSQSTGRLREPNLTTQRTLPVRARRFRSSVVHFPIVIAGIADRKSLDVDSLLMAGRIDSDVDEAVAAAAAAQFVINLESTSATDGGFLAWAVGLVDLIAGLEPSAAPTWCVARRALLSLITTAAGSGAGDCDPTVLLELVELADLVDVCGQSNRAVPYARDLVGRFYRKSVTQGNFFRDVRMTPSHFDELVVLSTPHLPPSSRGPTTIPPAYRIFSVLFWLAQGGNQRVVSRTVAVAESTFSKHCAPVIHAILAGLPKPEWPGCAERQEISRDFTRLTGGNAVGWKGLYVDADIPFAPRRLLLD